MTILEALKSINPYPIQDNTIIKICLDRGLEWTDEYIGTLNGIEPFDLATADIYTYLYSAPSLREQEISLTVADRDNYYKLAFVLYGKWDDDTLSSGQYGYIGEDFND